MANKTTPGIQNLRGSIGIGTTSPDEKLSVVGNTGLYGTVSGGIVSPASLRFFTSEDGAGLGDSTDSNKQKIGQITWAGKDTSSNAAGEYAAIRTYLIDSNNLIQGSGNEGGQIEFSILRHDVSGDPRVEYTAMTINNSANVGIGTTSPGAKLDVVGSIGVTSGNTFGFDSYHGSIYMATGGRGLLGKFGGSGYARNLIKSDGSATVHIGDNTSLISRILLDAGSSGTNGYISLQTKQSERVRIDENGNVGIGTTSPDSKLHIEGSTDGTGTGADAILHVKQTGGWNANEPWSLYVEGYSYLNGFRINAADGIRALHKVAAGGQLGFSVTDTAPITFTQSNSTERMRVHTNGNVGIGTTNPGYKLTVDNDDLNTNNPALYVKNPNSSTAAVIAEFVGDSDSIQIKNIGTGDYAIYNTQQSNGIALYDGAGGVEIHYAGVAVLEADSTGGIKVTGQLSATGDVVAYSSDERLKENIKPIENAVDKIKQLKGVTFDWNEKSQELGFEPSTKTNDVGVIAQDVEAVFPQLVHLAPFDIGSDEEGKATSRTGEDYKTVNYARLTAVLIEAVKEQQKQIDELKEIINGFTK